jgi:hypothetical protein
LKAVYVMNIQSFYFYGRYLFYGRIPGPALRGRGPGYPLQFLSPIFPFTALTGRVHSAGGLRYFRSYPLRVLTGGAYNKK